MAIIQRIDDDRSAAALADLLNGTARRRPVAVVTIPAGRDEPWIDAEEIAREAGNLAEVYLMPTGSSTWEFSRRMAEGTQVYGGAARVYPVGHEWTSDLSRSPLRFAFDTEDGKRATQNVISDMFRMAAAAGLLQSGPTLALLQVSGIVKMTVAGRALVDIGNIMPATVAEELTVADVAIDRIVTVGQEIQGRFDAETNRIDLTKGLRPASEALLTYAEGDVVWTRVIKVRSGTAELLLYPKTETSAVTVTVLRADVTTNPADDLRTLMSVGEVIRARLASVAPDWGLVLNDVEDHEPVVDAPSLLPGGPAWLIDEPEPVAIAEPRQVPKPLLPMQSAPEPLAPDPAAPLPVAPPRPTPTVFDRNRPRPDQDAPSAQPVSSTKSLLLKIDGLIASKANMTRERVGLQDLLRAAADERDQLRYLLDEAERRANRAENDLKAARSRLRKASASKPVATFGEGPRFADRETGFRYLVITQWATRTLPGEQDDRPLPDYVIGPKFLDSLEQLEGIKREKIADVAFEIISGLAPQIPAREVHRLRTGPGGEDPIRVRADGAVAWRANLQVKSPSARRIHYWVGGSGEIELARVATHDDFGA